MEITRGDYKRFNVIRKTKSNNETIMEKPNYMFFTVKRNNYTNDYVIQKTLDDGITFDEQTGYYTIEVNAVDTNDLDYGEYKYDIEVITDNKPKTIKKGVFEITDETTFATNETKEEIEVV